MFGLGIWELILLLAIVVLIFGGKNLASLGEGLGKAVSALNTGKSRPEAHQAGQEEDGPEKSSAGQILPELDQVRKIKAKADKIRNIARWTGLGRF
jgi:sec-independent protein translocase protein TatA